MMTIVQDQKRDNAKWWKESTFTAIFREALIFVRDKVVSGERVPAPNDPRDDVLRAVRVNEGSRQQLLDFLALWVAFPEDQLLERLKICFSSLNRIPS